MNHPRILHRVWLGPAEPPERFAGFTQAWRDLHPDWLVMEWHDDTVAATLLEAPGLYRDAPTWVHRADLVMVEAVVLFGGVAVGWDMEPTRPLGPLADGHEAWCTLDADGFPGGALFGARPGWPPLRRLLREVIPARVAEHGWREPHLDTGPWAWLDAFGPDGVMPDGMPVVAGTKAAYPVHYTEKHRLLEPGVIEGLRADPEVYVIHHFAGSWLNGGARVEGG